MIKQNEIGILPDGNLVSGEIDEGSIVLRTDRGKDLLGKAIATEYEIARKALIYRCKNRKM